MLAGAIEASEAATFSPDEPVRYRAARRRAAATTIHFMVAADFDAYWQAQRAIDALWQDKPAWWRIEHPEHRPDGLVLVRPRHLANTPPNLDVNIDATVKAAMNAPMRTLFIGHTYIDVTFLDRPHPGRATRNTSRRNMRCRSAATR